MTINREMRRAAARAGSRVVTATEVCAECWAPICPDCGVEALVCEDCGDYNCDQCGAHVNQPGAFVVRRTGHTLH